MNVQSQQPIDDFLRLYSLSESTAIHVLISGNIAYLGTEFLTSVNPLLGATFITIASLVGCAVAPTISSWLYLYLESTLVPIASLALTATVSCLSAKTICFAFGLQITFMQMIKVSAAFLVSVIILKFAVKKFKNNYQNRD